MSFDFPNSPTPNQRYKAATGLEYIWTGFCWNIVPDIDEGIPDAPLQPIGAVYGRTTGRWVDLDTVDLGLRFAGIGLQRDGVTVNLRPANLADELDPGGMGQIGGVKLIGRSPLNGLEYDTSTGLLTAPPGTDVVAGSIVEPPDDAVGYVRVRDAGVSNWVPVLDIAYGVYVGAIAPPTPRLGDLWWRSDPDGDLMIWYDDGSSQQWVAAAKPTGLMDSPHDGIVYGRQDGLWTPVTGAVSGDVPPATAVPNQLWYESDTGFLFINYDDGTSTQWVQIADSIPEGFLPLVGGTLTGPLYLPGVVPTVATEAVHKAYVDYAITAQSLYQGPWDVALNVPDLDPAVMNPLHNYSWIAQTADKDTPEAAPPQIPGIGGQMIGAGDSIIWNNNTQVYDLIQAPASLAAFVPIAGGTMTGTLDFAALPTSTHAIRIKGADDSGVTMKLSGSSTPHSGLIEFFDPSGTVRRGYIGYGGDSYLNLTAEGTNPGWYLTGSLKMQNATGIHWGNTSALTDVNDFSEGICLYGHGTTSQFGLNITSGTMNLSVQNNANKIDMNVGGTWRARVNNAGLQINGALGNASNNNVTYQNGFSGTMDFRVNPAMVTMRMFNVSKNTTENGASVVQWKICDYPAGVPAPWGNLVINVDLYTGDTYTYPGRHVMVQPRTDGVFMQLYGGAAAEDYNAGDRIACTVSWAR
jgi:hypothetical protein